MQKFLLVAALAACGGASGCTTEAPATLSPPEPTYAPTRWSAEYRTGSRLPLRDSRVSATTQPVQQFDAVEYEQQRPPMGDFRGPDR